jgi:hypothetical protein
MPSAPEPEQRRRSVERLREVGERRDADTAAHEQRSRDVEPETVSERAEDGELVARVQLAQFSRPGADRVDQERQLTLRREAERHRAR